MPAHTSEDQAADQAADLAQLRALADRGVKAAERIAAAFESIAADLHATRDALAPQIAAYQSGGWLALRTARRAAAKAPSNGSPE